jgi:hypothetical protein
MSNEFVARNGLIALDNSTVTGSLNVTNGITGSLFGTSSWAVSASNAISAAWAPGGAAAIAGGATNYAAVWASTTTLTTGSIFVTQSNVGIGTLVPAAKLQVSGTVNVVNFRGSGSLTTQSIFTVDGAAGRLFSVNDSLSGSLFSVNTIAGLPIIEAFSDNTVRIGQYGQRALFVSQSRVGINKETLLNANLDISGSAIITGSFTVISGSSREFQVTNIGVNIGNAITDIHTLTGSFNVSGSITTTGTITATTLVVQTITSSISWITGSTEFGSIISNTHEFTGSVNITGSLTSNGNTTITGSLTVSSGSSIDFQVTDTGTKIGANLTDTHIMTGSLSTTGSITGTSIIKSGGTSTQVLMADGSVKSNPTGSVVATSQTTLSTIYTDLATAGPTVTVTIRASGAAIVILTARTDNTNSGVEVFMGFAVSGATTVAASDAQALCSSARNAGDTPKYSAVFWVTGLNAGSNTFTSKYRTTANTATFADRNIMVIPI